MNSQLRELFEILAHYKVSLKPEECKMFVTCIKFCGHILTPGGRHRDPEKVAAIERWRWEDITTRRFYSDFNTVSLLCLSCCLLLV